MQASRESQVMCELSAPNSGIHSLDSRYYFTMLSMGEGVQIQYINAKQTLSSREEVCSVSIQAEHSDGTLKILAEGAVALKISISNLITSVDIRRPK